MNSRRQFVKAQTTTRSIRQGVNPMRIYPGPQQGNCPPILLLRRKKAVMRRKETSKGRKEMTRREEMITREMRVTGGVNNMMKGQ